MKGLKAIEVKTLQFFATNGPQTGYDLHTSKLKIMSSATWQKIRVEKNGLINQGFIKPIRTDPAMGQKGERGRPKIVYALSFKGLNYLLLNKLVKYDDVPFLVKNHSIETPEITDEQFDDFLISMEHLKKIRFQGASVIRTLIAVIGKERLRNLISFLLIKYPKTLFGDEGLDDYVPIFGTAILNPLLEESRYLKVLISKTIATMGFHMIKIFSDSDGIEFSKLIGEEACMIMDFYDPQHRKVPTENEILQLLTPERRSALEKKLHIR